MSSTIGNVLKNFKVMFRSLAMIALATVVLKDVWVRRTATIPIGVANGQGIRRVQSNSFVNHDGVASTSQDETSIH